MDHQHLSAPKRASITIELPAAIIVARRLLDTYGTVDYGQAADVAQAHGALAESLRILLRAIDQTVQQAIEQQQYEAVCRSVDAQFPIVAAFLAAERGEGL
ncbi:hypothetical protein [Streptomyces sp. NPDC058045]|uniref:hypothetical protein n=1 Tax=Streptomyces sp. NPDC058045 TaxID=3346311 RepID=UPI0036EC36CF